MDPRSVVGMETAPKPGRGVPPKKDKPQAKRKVVLVGGVRAPGPGSGCACESFYLCSLETAALLGGGAHPVRRRRLSGAASEEGEDWGAATPEVPERAHRPEVSVLQEAPDPKERLRPEEAAEDPVWGEPGVDRVAVQVAP